MVERTKKKNRNAYDVYSDRHAIMVRVAYEEWGCTSTTYGGKCCAYDSNRCIGGYGCGSTCQSYGWVSKEAPNRIRTIYGDGQIVDRFDTSWEDEKDKRSLYHVIGVGGRLS